MVAAKNVTTSPMETMLNTGFWRTMTALAWNLKAWLALSLDVSRGRARVEQQARQQQLVGLEFRTFVNYFLRLPAQVLRTGQRIIVRLLAYNAWQGVFFRLATQLARPRRR